MPTQYESTVRRGNSGHAAVRAVVLLVLALLGSAVAAEEPSSWSLQPSVDLRTASYYEYSGGASATNLALGTELSIELSTPHRPFSTGLFADFEIGSHAEAGQSRLIGSWFSYRYGRWSLSAVAAQFSADEVNGLWLHATKLQFEPRPGHRLAIKAIGSLQGSDDPGLQFVYKTNLSRQATLSISVGLGSNRMRDVGASTEFVWNLF